MKSKQIFFFRFRFLTSATIVVIHPLFYACEKGEGEGLKFKKIEIISTDFNEKMSPKDLRKT